MVWRGVIAAWWMMGLAPALAESPIGISSEVENGWTSNATDSAAGAADFFTTHRHEMSVTGQSDTVLLRGSLVISQTRFLQTTFKDDASVTGGVETEFALGPNMLLRLGYGVTRSWTGDDLALGSVVLPLESEDTEHEFLAEVVVIGADQQVVLGVDGDWLEQGDTIIGGLDLPPLRLKPHVALLTARVAWERAFSPAMAVLAGMEGWLTRIPEADQLLYLRPAADGGRARLGLRLQRDQFAVEGFGGVDAIWPQGMQEMTELAPHLALAASLKPAASLRLTAAAETGVELADPVDNVAGRTASAELGARWDVTPAWALSVELAGRRESGIYDDSLVRSRQVAALTARFTASEKHAYAATLSLSHHENPGESYDKAGIALTLSGRL